MVREKDVDALPAWLASASTCSAPELRTFARGIEQDQAAVEAALSRKVKQWTNGRPDYEAETDETFDVWPREFCPPPSARFESRLEEDDNYG